MQRFLLAENPMVENSDLAIIHTQNPISIILVLEGHVKSKHPYAHFNYINTFEQTEPITLALYHCFTTSFDGDEHARMADKVLLKAFHWYASYLEWEDAQLEEDGAED